MINSRLRVKSVVQRIHHKLVQERFFRSMSNALIGVVVKSIFCILFIVADSVAHLCGTRWKKCKYLF